MGVAAAGRRRWGGEVGFRVGGFFRRRRGVLTGGGKGVGVGF